MPEPAAALSRSRIVPDCPTPFLGGRPRYFEIGQKVVSPQGRVGRVVALRPGAGFALCLVEFPPQAVPGRPGVLAFDCPIAYLSQALSAWGG
jgi:hypothetical protein